MFYGNIYTDQLWVHLDCCGKGYGHKLMESVHDYGREIGCSIATVVTMSFQGAKDFYEHLDMNMILNALPMSRAPVVRF